MRLLAGGLSRLPFAFSQGLGWLLGTLLRYVPNKQRRNALINLRLCHPDWAEAEIRRFRDRALREEAKTFVEIAYLLLRPVPQVLSLIRETQGLELLERPGGQGLIVLSPHLGAWEMAGLFLSTRGPTTTLYKPQPLADELVRQAREVTHAGLGTTAKLPWPTHRGSARRTSVGPSTTDGGGPGGAMLAGACAHCAVSGFVDQRSLS